MTGPRPPEPADPGDVRAEDAFRAAFVAHALDAEFRPMDPEQLRLLAGIRAQSDAAAASGAGVAPSEQLVGAGAPALVPVAPLATVTPLAARRRRRPLLAGLAAAAVLVVAVPLGLSLVSQRDAGVSSTAGGAAGPVAPVGQSASVPQERALPNAQPSTAAVPASASGRATFEAPAGTRWVTIRDVAVAVPASWGTGLAPDNPWPWCAPLPDGLSFGKQPYVAVDQVPATVPSVLCPGGGVPEDVQVEHLEWREATQAVADGDVTTNGWIYTSRTLGSVRLTYVHRPGVDPNPILATAHTVEGATASGTPSR